MVPTFGASDSGEEPIDEWWMVMSGYSIRRIWVYSEMLYGGSKEEGGA